MTCFSPKSTPFLIPGRSQVVVTATDPSMEQLSTSDVDYVTLARNLELGLRKTGLYIEGAPGGADTVDYSFEVRPGGHQGTDRARVRSGSV